MERREFLRLGAIFAMGATISPNVGSILSDLSGFKDPSYIYKIKHRSGLIVIFSSEHPDEKNIKLSKKFKDEYFFSKDDYFFSKSLELIKIVEKKDLDTEMESLQNTDDVKSSEEEFEKNVSSEILEISGQKLEKDHIDKNIIPNLNLTEWWTGDLSDDDKNIIRETYCWQQERESWSTLVIPTIAMRNDFGNFEKISLPVTEEDYFEPINYWKFDGIIDYNRKVIEFLNSISGEYGYLSAYKYSSTYEKILLKLDCYIFDFGNVKGIHNHYGKWIKHLYKRRKEDRRYLELTKYYCSKQIEIASDFMKYCVEENIKRNNEEIDFKKSCLNGDFDFTEDHIKECVNPLDISYYDYIPDHYGFRQLSIILEKEGKYKEAISVCKNALMIGFRGDWEKRIIKNSNKLKKMKLAC
jgi:hypothetical protein